MRFTRLRVLIGLWLLPFLLCAQVQPPSPATPPAISGSADMIDSLRLRDAPLDLVLDRLEAWTGRIILRPQALPAAVITLNISRPMPKAEAVQAVISVLALNNIGVIEMGDKFLKVVELANKSRSEAPEMITGSTLDLPASGKVASKVFEVNYLKAADLVAQLNTTLNVQVGGAVFFTNTNAFLVTDTIANLQRIEQLLLGLDRPAMANFKPKFYTLRFAKASDLVTKVKVMLQGPGQLTFGNSTTLSPDDRTNQIILIADPKQYAFYDELITKLDIKADPNTRNEVIYLKHATAKDVASLLTTVITGQNTAASKNGATRPAQSGGGFNGTSPFAPPPATPNAPATTTPTPTATAAATAAAAATEFSSFLTVTSDERSNAVVVSGTLDDIRLIRELVDKIDIVLAQVRIEVIIAEVTLTDTDQSGLTALKLTVDRNSSGFDKITNFEGSVAGWSVTGGQVDPLKFVAAMSNTGSKNQLKVLSAPTIVTTHNNEAEIIVGQSQPILNGTQTSASTTGGTPVSSSTYTYKDIAIDLKVTPLIGDDGNIQLKIDQQVNDIIGQVVVDPTTSATQPIIGRRQATSFINVIDGEMVVLGGLQRTKKENDRTKLGFIWEIPVISQLLGGRTKSTERTELLLFIRPHVIPPSLGSADARKEINRLSNRDDVNAYLNPPTPPAPPVKPAPATPTAALPASPVSAAPTPTAVLSPKRPR